MPDTVYSRKDIYVSLYLSISHIGGEYHQIKIPSKTKITNHRTVIRVQYLHSMVVSMREDLFFDMVFEAISFDGVSERLLFNANSAMF